MDITKPEERKNNEAIGKSIIRKGKATQKKRELAKKMKGDRFMHISSVETFHGGTGWPGKRDVRKLPKK